MVKRKLMHELIFNAQKILSQILLKKACFSYKF